MARVAWVGDAREVTVCFEAGDNLGHCLAGDTQGFGQVGGVPAAAKERDQQDGVQRWS